MINEKYENKKGQQENENQQFLERIQSISNKIFEYKNNVIQQVDTIIRILNQWMISIESCTGILKPQGLIQDLYFLHQNQFNQQDQEINNVNKAHVFKFLKQIKKLLIKDELDSLKKQTQQLIVLTQANLKTSNLKTSYQEQNHNQIIDVPKKVVQVNIIKQNEFCRAIAFNKTGEIIITCCGKKLKVWVFHKGNFIEAKTLIGHTNSIFCLVFSKSQNWFASSGYDQTIIGWKEKRDDWVSSQPQKQHSNTISGLLLNSSNDELISFSDDNTIIVWKVDCQQNIINFKYTLNRHKKGVNGISQNINETALASCSDDETIILWIKGQKQQWEYITHINVSIGYRICFVSENIILYQPSKFGYTLIFKIENKQQLIEQNNLIINLKESNNDRTLFPTIYNQKRQIIIQRQGQYVYLLQRQKNGSFEIVLEPIDCRSPDNYGTLSEDGEYLVIWNDRNKEFRVHQIIY